MDWRKIDLELEHRGVDRDSVISNEPDNVYTLPLAATPSFLPRNHQIVALANLIPLDDSVNELDSYMYQIVLCELWKPWQDSVFIKLLGKSVGFLTMRDKLKAAWKPSGGLDMMDVGNGYYMVKFDLAADKEKVIEGGPWMIFDHYLTVRPWVPDFVSSQATITSTLVWIRFTKLGMEYYDESVLLGLASAVGSPLRVDMMTLNATRGNFARVCVEIDLTKLVVGKAWLRGHWYKVEYEGLHLLCSHCGCYGHVSRNCTKVT